MQEAGVNSFFEILPLALEMLKFCPTCWMSMEGFERWVTYDHYFQECVEYKKWNVGERFCS